MIEVDLLSVDDVFLCIGDNILVAPGSYALQRREADPSYRFAVVVPSLRGTPSERMIQSLGGIILGSMNLNSVSLSCKRVVLHSFGDVEWQLRMLSQIRHDMTAVYSDYLKNEYAEPLVRQLGCSGIIFFGWVFQKPFMDIFEKIEVTRFRHCHKVFDLIKKECDLPPLRLRPGVTAANSVLVFLRYWGSGVYKFQQNVTLGDVLLRTLDEDRDVTIYVKDDPRIHRSQYESVFTRLQQDGYHVRPISNLLDEPVPPALDTLFAEFLVEAISGAGFRCYTFDSSICFALQMCAGAKIVFPTAHELQDVFQDRAGMQTVLNYTSFYERVCRMIAQGDPEETTITISP